jgi:RNA polymerase sigma-70 factor, ECF subfamily
VELLGETPASGPAAVVDPDAELVRRANAGETVAFELLVVKYRRRVERLIHRMVRDNDHVQDLTQETFLSAWRALAQFRGDAQFYTWLYRIASNQAKKHLLAHKRSRLVFENETASQDDDGDARAPRNELTVDETPESVLAAREIGEAVSAALDALPEELRRAVVLREMEGMSYEDIALTMNSPIGTVRSRIFRAREVISARVKPLLTRQTGKRW